MKIAILKVRGRTYGLVEWGVFVDFLFIWPTKIGYSNEHSESTVKTLL